MASRFARLSGRMLFLIEAYWLLRPFGGLEPFDLEPHSGDFYSLIGTPRDADAETIERACTVWKEQCVFS